jgi:signal transduction histidine kinase
MTILPSNQDFATEIRTDRLQMIANITLASCLFLFFGTITIGAISRASIVGWLLASLIIGAGAWFCKFFLKRERFDLAVWVFAGGFTVAIGLILMAQDMLTAQLLPFLFPLLVFIIGLLVRPTRALWLAVTAAVISIALPLISGSGFGWHQVFAVALIFLSWLLAAQVTGELYQIADWALQNYQKERRTTEALHENRELLERTLARSQALSNQLGEANEQLEDARQTAEVAKFYRGQFLANMSHELRTPLNAIIGFSETMLKFPMMYNDVELPNEYRHDLSQIYNSGRQLLSLINDILDISRIDAGKLEVQIQQVELLPVIEGVSAIAEGLLGTKPIQLVQDLPDDLPDVWADEARVRQVLINLYSNAVKFTDEGPITLKITNTEEEVCLSLRDSGSGIDPKYHQVIFEEFKQAETEGRDPRSGSGLGLAICKHLLTLMGGRIWVESALGQGSTFSFVLPRYRPGAEPPARSTTEIAAILEPTPAGGS